MSFIDTLATRLEASARSRLGLPSRWVPRTLAGVALTVREETFRDPPAIDYDDAWLFACAQHAQTVFDVGANIGQSTLLVLAAKHAQQVVLVDANRDALAVAADNLIHNQLSASCRFVAAFAGEHDDQSVEFWTVGTGAAGSMYKGHATTAARAGRVSTVQTVTLDTLAARFAITPELVKIDVEGAEAQVLAGARTLAAAGTTRFLIEMHSPPELPMTTNAALVLAWAQALDYKVWYLSDAVELTTPALVAHRGRCHLLVQPAAWPYPEWLRGIAQSAALPA